MTRFMRCLMAAVFLFPFAARAEWSSTDLLQLQLDAWQARGGFHQLSIRGNAPADISSLQDVLDSGEAHLAVLAETASLESEQTLLLQLRQDWERLARRALDNPLATQGYADYEAFSELNTFTLALHRAIGERLREMPERPMDAMLELAIRLQRISSEYLALTAFPSAGINAGTREEPLDFSSEAMAFEKSLDKLQAQYASNDALSRTLKQVATRWSFIRGAIPALDDPGSAKVPLLFHRYSGDIAADLSLVASLAGDDAQG
ncbi:MAG: hypothetical protein P1U64_11195 [Alcanivoracaceae bacterium]|jgi:hypothetical protein|nr:hypothetical protein [Alcanivoracaceae bacterium]